MRRSWTSTPSGTESNDQMRRDGENVQASHVRKNAQAYRDRLNNQRLRLSDGSQVEVSRGGENQLQAQ